MNPLSLLNSTESGSSDYEEYPGGNSNPQELSIIAKVFAVIIYSCLSILAIGGNSIVVFIVFYFRRMRSPTNLLILNLALADLMISTFCMPLSYWPIIITKNQRWVFGEVLCRVLPFLQGTAVFLSSWTLVAISFDRFIAIMFLLKPEMRVTRGKAIILIGLTWCFSVIMALPMLLVNRIEKSHHENVPVCSEYGWQEFTNKTLIDNQSYSNGVFVLQYCIPLGVLIITYTGIGLKVWNSRPPGTQEINGQNRKIAHTRRENVKKMIPMMILISFLYGICWLPQNILINILLPINPELASGTHILYVWWAVNTVAMSHSVVNPIVYYSRNHKFREGFIYVFKWLPFVRFDGLDLLSDRSHKSQAVRIVNMVAYIPVTAKHIPTSENQTEDDERDTVTKTAENTCTSC